MRWSDKTGEESKGSLTTVWRVMHRKTGQEFTICDGHDGYLKAPAPPAVKLARFWGHLPAGVQRNESEEELFPPSDICRPSTFRTNINRSRGEGCASTAV